MKKSNIKLFLILLSVVVIFTCGILYFSQLRTEGAKPANKNLVINGLYLPKPQIIQDFHLTDNQGHPFTKQNLTGHWTLLFFGFTNCGYVCPTTLAALNIVYKNLAHDLPSNKIPQVVMISVDPKRDSFTRMNDYVHSFNPNFRGARGDINETISLEKQLHISAAIIQSSRKGDNNYTITHSDEILLVNPEGNLQAYFSNPHDATDKMISDYKLILEANHE